MPARFLSAGDTALTIELGKSGDLSFALQIQDLQARIEDLAVPGIVEVVPTIRSLTIHYDPCATSAGELRNRLATVADTASNAHVMANRTTAKYSRPPRRWLIPACYEPEHGVDIDEICWTCGLHPADVVELHTRQSYRVLMVGFLPGQPYLGELPADLRLPRRTTPRISVPAGAIAIATTLSVIYPQTSPGGWHIIGRTPVALFDATKQEPSLLTAGDEVRFHAISSSEYESLASRARATEFQFKPLAEAA